MKFTNLVAYCKGFYMRSANVIEMWKDMAHCIMCDGYYVRTKSDVVQYCLNFFEKFAKEFPNEAYKVSIGILYEEIMKNKIYLSDSNDKDAEVDTDIALIYTFMNFVRYIDADKFTDGVVPNGEILPLNLYTISAPLWNDLTEKFERQNPLNFDVYEIREQKLS